MIPGFFFHARKPLMVEPVKKHQLRARKTRPDQKQRKVPEDRQETKQGGARATPTRSRNKPIPFRAKPPMSRLSPVEISRACRLQ